MAEVANIFGLFFHGKSYVFILSQNVLGYIWPIFSQNHPATLLPGSVNSLCDRYE
jgi:hypothetical protein